MYVSTRGVLGRVVRHLSQRYTFYTRAGGGGGRCLGRPARVKRKDESNGPTALAGAGARASWQSCRTGWIGGCKRQRGLSSRVVAKPRHTSVVRGWAGLGLFAGGFAMHALLRCTFRESEGANLRSIDDGRGVGQSRTVSAGRQRRGRFKKRPEEQSEGRVRRERGGGV